MKNKSQGISCRSKQQRKERFATNLRKIWDQTKASNEKHSTKKPMKIKFD